MDAARGDRQDGQSGPGLGLYGGARVHGPLALPLADRQGPQCGGPADQGAAEDRGGAPGDLPASDRRADQEKVGLTFTDQMREGGGECLRPGLVRLERYDGARSGVQKSCRGLVTEAHDVHVAGDGGGGRHELGGELHVLREHEDA